MTLIELLTNPKGQRSLALFDPKEVQAVEALLIEKNG
jgi:hypothetical protein